MQKRVEREKEDTTIELSPETGDKIRNLSGRSKVLESTRRFFFRQCTLVTIAALTFLTSAFYLMGESKGALLLIDEVLNITVQLLKNQLIESGREFNASRAIATEDYTTSTLTPTSLAENLTATLPSSTIN